MMFDKKKKIAMTAIVALGLGFLIGCGSAGGDTEPSANAVISGTAQEIADGLKNQGSFKDQLAELSEEVAIDKLYELDGDKIAEAAFYTNTNATAEEIAVIKCSDSGYTAEVAAAYETRISDQKEACENYLPDEMPKLDKAVIVTSGDYVVLCISCDSQKAEDVINQFKK